MCTCACLARLWCSGMICVQCEAEMKCLLIIGSRHAAAEQHAIARAVRVPTPSAQRPTQGAPHAHLPQSCSAVRVQQLGAVGCGNLVPEFHGHSAVVGCVFTALNSKGRRSLSASGVQQGSADTCIDRKARVRLAGTSVR